MIRKDTDAEGLLLDQTYFALHAESFAMFLEQIGSPLPTTEGFLRTLTSRAPLDSKAAPMGNFTGFDGKCKLE